MELAQADREDGSGYTSSQKPEGYSSSRTREPLAAGDGVWPWVNIGSAVWHGLRLCLLQKPAEWTELCSLIVVQARQVDVFGGEGWTAPGHYRRCCGSA